MLTGERHPRVRSARRSSSPRSRSPQVLDPAAMTGQGRLRMSRCRASPFAGSLSSRRWPAAPRRVLSRTEGERSILRQLVRHRTAGDDARLRAFGAAVHRPSVGFTRADGWQRIESRIPRRGDRLRRRSRGSVWAFGVDRRSRRSDLQRAQRRAARKRAGARSGPSPAAPAATPASSGEYTLTWQYVMPTERGVVQARRRQRRYLKGRAAMSGSASP